MKPYALVYEQEVPERIEELDNVAVLAVADNDVLSYDSTTAKWINQTASQAGLATTALVTSGTYSPTRSAEANLDSNVTPSSAQYMRVNTVVTVSGNVTIDPTLTATTTSWEMTLPVASNIGAVEDLAGTFACGQIVGMSGAISGSVANNTAVFTFISSDVNSQVVYYSYSYEII